MGTTESLEQQEGEQHQARCQDEVKGCRESLETIVRDINNRRALLDAACDDLADAGTKTIDLKRKADDAHGSTRSHRDRCRRATKDAWVSSSRTLRGLPHALSCGVPDRDSLTRQNTRGRPST